MTLLKIDRPLALILDDDESILKTRIELFKAGGFEVVSSCSFGEAVDKVRMEAVDIIITDINLLPERTLDKSGIDFAKLVRKIKPGVPIVGYSAYYAANDLHRHELDIFDHYYSKGESTTKQILKHITMCRELAIGNKARIKNELEYDVFLSYNSQDKNIANRLAKILRCRGIKVWYDHWELVPGRVWQDELEKTLDNTKAALVAIGKGGVGPWEKQEMRVLLNEYAKRGLPIIPVLFSSSDEQPKLPLFLQQFTWVDLRKGLRKDAIDRLEWGITGKKAKK